MRAIVGLLLLLTGRAVAETPDPPPPDWADKTPIGQMCWLNKSTGQKINQEDASAVQDERALEAARLASVLGQNGVRLLTVARADPQGATRPAGTATAPTERLVPDDMDRTLLLNAPLTLGDYNVTTLLLKGTPDGFAREVAQQEDGVIKPDGAGKQEKKVSLDLARLWWRQGRVTQLDLLNADNVDGKSANASWRVHVPQYTSALGPLWPLQTETFAIVACPAKNTDLALAFAVTRNVSDKWSAIADTVFAVFLIWGLAAWARAASLRDGKAPPPASVARPVRNRLERTIHMLDPVVITQDDLGYGSMSRLQVFFFTLVVVATLTYVFLRAGYLSEISDNLLWLMGITGLSTGATAVFAKGRESKGDAVTFATERWLLRHGVMIPPREAYWRDLLMNGRELNVFNFQALVFSVLVGFWILSSAMQNLADLTIPSNLMALLGLSQAVYVSGKAVGAGTARIKQVNDAVAHAIASETTLIRLLPVDGAYRRAAQARGRRHDGAAGPRLVTPDVKVPDEAADALRMFVLDAEAAVSIAADVLNGRFEAPMQPVDPPDDTAGAWAAAPAAVPPANVSQASASPNSSRIAAQDRASASGE